MMQTRKTRGPFNWKLFVFKSMTVIYKHKEVFESDAEHMLFIRPVYSVPYSRKVNIINSQ